MLRRGVGVSMVVFAKLLIGGCSRLVGVVLCPSGTLRVVVQVYVSYTTPDRADTILQTMQQLRKIVNWRK